ncbi:MAG TPA: VWA domain-containing protein, partial [Planctomycetota bacterium]|nr:VWA domain-containing protein [Planctomycetota bacterium]
MEGRTLTPHDLFLAPERAWLLALAPLAWAGGAWLERRREREVRVALGPRAAELHDVSRRRRAAGRALGAAALFFGATAAMEPAFGESAASTPRGVDVVIALDVSRSMLARDAAPDRLGAARRELEGLLARAAGDRFGLVAFAGDATRVCPLTRDLASFRTLLAGVDVDLPRRGGSDLAAALDAAAAAFPEGATEGGAVVLLTDGEDHGGRAVDAAARARARGLAVHAVAYGAADGGKIVVDDGAGGSRVLTDATGRDVIS